MISSWKTALEVHKVSTTKDKIKQPHLCAADLFPRINDSILAVGTSGSGKSTVIAHLFTNKFVWKNFFDRIFLFSPTGEADDIQKSLKLEDFDENTLPTLGEELLPNIPSIITDMSLAPGYLKEIEDSQKKLIKENGAHKAPLIAVYYDDFIGENDFMKSKEFMDSFILCRHYNMTTIACAQAYTGVPRKQRMQARHIFYFKGNQTETDQMIEQYAPPGCDKKTMEGIIKFATEKEYDFLYINKRSPIKNRFRRGFTDIIRFICQDMNEENLKKKFRIQNNGEEQEKTPECTENNTSECDSSIVDKYSGE